MTEEATIFDTTTPASISTPATVPAIPTEVADLVGEGKKYQSVNDALRSVPHAQKHIQTLEAELAQTKEELTKRKTTQDLLDELKSGIQSGTTAPNVEFDQDRIEAIAVQVVEQRDRQAKANANVGTVINAFDSMYGEKGKEMYVKLAEDSGLPLSALNSLAASSPTAVLKLAGITSKQEIAIPGKTQSSVNTEALSNQSQQTLSARVGKSNSSRDVLNAWKIAGEKVKQLG